jgi:hypothetical protein
MAQVQVIGQAWEGKHSALSSLPIMPASSSVASLAVPVFTFYHSWWTCQTREKNPPSLAATIGVSLLVMRPHLQ